MKSISLPLEYFPISSSSLRAQRRVSSWRSKSTTTQTFSGYSNKALHTDHFQDFPLEAESKMMELKEITRLSLQESLHMTDILTLVDSIDRLGIGYHFGEINTILDRVSDMNFNDKDLFTTSLSFRLLRQNGYAITQDIFRKFVDENGKFKKSLRIDIQGMLSLYEASYLGSDREDLLSQAMIFTKKHLRSSTNQQFARQIFQEIELPRHLRMTRLETRRYIDELGKESKTAPHLLELAKLDFNRVQSLHRQELAEITRWWKELCLVQKLGFGRDRPTECYLWTVGILPEPYYSECRIELAKMIALLLVIDDMFDSYGSLDDLVIFTQTIERWDINKIHQLPEYMKICYMALYNTVNDIGYKILKRHGRYVVSQLKNTWIDMVKAYLVEAEWFNKEYVPTTEEYLENGVTTAGSYMALVLISFLIGGEENIQTMVPYPKLFSNSGRILRLWDDLGTATEEEERGGDVASSIDCTMRDKGLLSEDEARVHIKQLINSLWTEMNQELIYPQALPLPLVKGALNMSRTAQVIYQHGDDVKFPSVGDCVKSLFYTPIGI